MPTNLLQARKAAAERFAAIAAKYTPADVQVSYRRKLTGCAWAMSRRVCVPHPRTRRALHIYLHEIGHIVLQHVHLKPEYLQEYEAELWAFEVMKAEAVEIPPQSIRRAADYVSFLAARAERAGVAVDYSQLDLQRFQRLA